MSVRVVLYLRLKPISSDIHAVSHLYTTLYDAIVADTAGHGRNGFYFGASGEHSLYDVGKAIGQALVALGKGDNPEPTTFSQAELDKYYKVRIEFSIISDGFEC